MGGSFVRFRRIVHWMPLSPLGCSISVKGIGYEKPQSHLLACYFALR
jgi:hypothetical protein